jgi:hypothetical protein
MSMISSSFKVDEAVEIDRAKAFFEKEEVEPREDVERPKRWKASSSTSDGDEETNRGSPSYD